MEWGIYIPFNGPVQDNFPQTDLWPEVWFPFCKRNIIDVFKFVCPNLGPNDGNGKMKKNAEWMFSFIN